MLNLDWKDVAIHAAVGLGVAVGAFLFGWPLLAASPLFWFGRELKQRKDKGQPLDRTWKEPQVILEWSVPAGLAPVVWALLHIAS